MGVGAGPLVEGGGVTTRLDVDVTPLTGDLTWLEEYAKARASMRWEIVDYTNATPRLAMPWPWVARLYDGWDLEPEPEPVNARLW